MEVQEFIQNFADLFDDTDVSIFKLETKFRELDEWSSLAALSVMSMIDDEYDVQVTANEMRNANTIYGNQKIFYNDINLCNQYP